MADVDGPKNSNPKWVWDEQVLAFDLFLRRPGAKKTGPEFEELSSVLRSLPIHPEGVRRSQFRSAMSASRKFQDIRTHQPGFAETKETKGSAYDEQTWKRYGDRPHALIAAIAAAIRKAAADPELQTPIDDEGEVEESAIVSRILYRRHRALERNEGLPLLRVKHLDLRGGSPTCEICGVGAITWPSIGADPLTPHITLPHHEERRARGADLVLLCRTCHWAAHRVRDGATLEELRSLRSP